MVFSSRAVDWLDRVTVVIVVQHELSIGRKSDRELAQAADKAFDLQRRVGYDLVTLDIDDL